MKRSLCLLAALLAALASCTKYEKGFLSPNIQYLQSDYTISKGRVYTSDAVNPDGSSQPLTVTLVHVYDSAGNNVDSIFFKKYPVTTWTSAYNATTDTTLSDIKAKQQVQQLPPISLNSGSGVIDANFATIYLPAGTYSLDERISNVVGSEMFHNFVKITLVDAPAYQSVPDLGTTYDKLFKVGNESVTRLAATPVITINYLADTPNLIILKMVDQNGVPFDPKTGEIVKRPNSGVNPTPPYLQCFENYTNSYTYTDTAMLFNYALTPFPFASLGNGFNLYYRIPTQYFSAAGQPDGMWSANPRLPFRLWVPGVYSITMRFPDLTHK
ncbi:DUF5007 domain-containing protein [Dinghuibacter silviterrae]|uniref:Uncharacterized protein DUF5007 n=1 Tax=Dinghuibacter silviterrae TaxID=1539049 RepID=A0A4R8DEA0_9BACT|nr:DUF5007 domain-containing protein [Dinghuibacter silviterrae]TDW95863.1 uncharacterized protein DUF5007 [Dinghuibacter silviterrae]